MKLTNAALALLTALLLLIVRPGWAQEDNPAAPEALPGFAYFRDQSGASWLKRHEAGWEYFARPTSGVWKNPPLAVLATNTLLPQAQTHNFGLDLNALPDSVGFSSNQPGKAFATLDADAADSKTAEEGDAGLTFWPWSKARIASEIELIAGVVTIAVLLLLVLLVGVVAYVRRPG